MEDVLFRTNHGLPKARGRNPTAATKKDTSSGDQENLFVSRSTFKLVLN